MTTRAGKDTLRSKGPRMFEAAATHERAAIAPQSPEGKGMAAARWWSSHCRCAVHGGVQILESFLVLLGAARSSFIGWVCMYHVLPLCTIDKSLQQPHQLGRYSRVVWGVRRNEQGRLVGLRDAVPKSRPAEAAAAVAASSSFFCWLAGRAREVDAATRGRETTI